AVASLREIERACAGLEGADLARAQTVRLAVLANLGRRDIDLAFTAQALHALKGDVIWQARLLQNRGVARLSQEELGGEVDLRAARQLWCSLGARPAVAVIDVALMRVALAQGDVPEALRRLSRIEVDGLPERIVGVVQSDGGRVLLAARLLDEAAESL